MDLCPCTKLLGTFQLHLDIPSSLLERKKKLPTAGRGAVIPYLLVNYRAHEVFNSREGQVLSFNGDGLSSETDLQKERDPVHRAPGVCEALRAETAIGEPTGEPRLGT